MQKLLIFLFLNAILWALPTHSPNRATYFHDDASTFNPCNPCFLWQEALNLRFAYVGDFVFNRDMEKRENRHRRGDIQTFAITTNGGAATLNIADWFEFYGRLGATNFSIITPHRVNGRQSELFFSPRLSWAIGTHATVWKYHALAFGFAAEYFRTAAMLDAFLSYQGGRLTYFNDIEKPKYYEWMVACGFSYTFTGPGYNEFIPHIALSASEAKMGMHRPTFTNDGTEYDFLNMKSRKMWGYEVGLNWILNRKVAAGCEFHFADQKALHLIGEVAF